MPRQNRRRRDPSADEGGAVEALRTMGQRRDFWRGEWYAVRSVRGSAAGKSYRCPGCDQQVLAGAAHVVAWPELDQDASDRRHWHTSCWAARDRRAPSIQRGRSAPRY